MTNPTNTTYVVRYKSGTDYTHKAFASLPEALKKLDEESQMSDGQRTSDDIAIAEYDIEYSEFDDMNYTEQEEYMSETQPLRSETVIQWRVNEIWGEKLTDGNIVNLGFSCEDKPEAEQDGEIIEAYADDIEIYETWEDAKSANLHSQYLVNF